MVFSGRSEKTDQSAVVMDFDQISAGLFISNHCSVSVVSIDMRIQRVCWLRAALGLLNCQSPGWKGKSQVLSDQWRIIHQLRQFCCSREVSLIVGLTLGVGWLVSESGKQGRMVAREGAGVVF
jgi:hypothetical protein